MDSTGGRASGGGGERREEVAMGMWEYWGWTLLRYVVNVYKNCPKINSFHLGIGYNE